jgi:molecular chaperone DnaK
MGKTIGIDLGTTNSCVSYVSEEGDLTVIPNAEGGRTTPSVVAFTDDGQRLVGHMAKRQAETNPENTIFAVKRLMGQRYDSEDVHRVIMSAPYQVAEAENGDAWIRAQDEEYSPAEISSFILRELRHQAEDFLEEEIEDAVITVPAYFNDAQRQATKDAGRIAGLNVQRIVNEPTAAALAYGLGQAGHPDEQVVAVYDLGGGTFDVSILTLADGVFSVNSTAGDTFLGGEDFDYRIIDWMADNFQDEHHIDLRLHKEALQRLKEEAERVKCELSSSESAEINLPFIHTTDDGPLHIDTELTRAEYEEMVGDLAERTLEPCRQALSDAGMSPRQLDRILLVGGMTRTPLIRRKVGEFFDTEPDTSLNPDEVVALGAAVQSSIVRGELTDVLLLDVTPLTLGIETMGGIVEPLIPRNTTIPCSYSEVFTTARDAQEMVRVNVVQGERRMADDNKSLATFELTGLPPAPRGVPKIEVTFSLDENGIVSVRARDEGTGREQVVRVVADGGLDEEEIQRMVQEGEEFEQRDQEAAERVELQNQARGLLFSTERSLEEYGELLPPEDHEAISQDISTVKELLDDANVEELRTIIASLEASAFQLAELMYGGMEDEELEEGEAPPAEGADEGAEDAARAVEE